MAETFPGTFPWSFGDESSSLTGDTYIIKVDGKKFYINVGDRTKKFYIIKRN